MIHSILLIIILGSYTRLDNNTLLSSRPPICILLHTESALIVPFLNLPCNVYPVFPIKSSVTAKGATFKKKQIGITPGFTYIEYKVQGAMFKSATLDLRQRTVKRTTENHKQFCSTYVQLSRLQSLEGVSFLEPISLENINNQPHHQLQVEDERLQRLGDITSLSFANAAARRRQHM